MRWQIGRRSSNVEDVRGQSGGGLGGGGLGGGFGGRGFPGGNAGRAGGIGGIGLLIMIVIGLFLGVDPRAFLGGGDAGYDGGGGPAGTQEAPVNRSPEEQTQADFVSSVLASTEDQWQAIFQERQATYQEPRLVLFSEAIRSACGSAQSATGPFYCPADQKVYLDLEFFTELERKYQAPGDFARAYVVAHEIGHHVQNLLGITDKVRAYQGQNGQAAANEASVALELQADCLAGLWAARANRESKILEPGDVEEALGAASAIGDDRLQRQARGYVNPDSFTHGSSAQRVRWFKTGFEQGRLEACDTFAAGTL